MAENRPRFVYDHLVKERYPTFVDALKDIDDALCMIFLFAILRCQTFKSHTSVVSVTCLKLAREWQNYVFYAHCLSKVFVSIKGIYYQARVQDQPITWLVPHKFSHPIPGDVDYRMMVTFLTFYQTAIKFVNFKLYHDAGLHYPPKLDLIKDAAENGLQLFLFQTIDENKKEEKEKEDERKRKKEEDSDYSSSEENEIIKIKQQKKTRIKKDQQNHQQQLRIYKTM